MWDNLPTEISNDILHRLGVKTLIKCTTLSKSFLPVITRGKWQISPIRLLLCANDTFTGFRSQGLLIPFYNHNDVFTVAGCVNGVLCLVNDFGGYEGTDIILWNPSIRKFVHVPQPIMVYKTYGSYMSACGFGFDPITDDYKVVRVVYLEEPPTQVEVFSLKTGCWRVIGDGPSHLIKRYESEYKGYIPCFSNGSIYWVGYHMRGPNKHVILKFDMFTESFEIIQVPEILREDEDESTCTRVMDLYVQECKGNLTLIKRDYNDAIKTCSAWLMKEDGVAKSWTKMFDFDIAKLHPCVMPRAFGFRKNGEVIMVKGGYNTLSRSKIVVTSTDRVTHDDTALGEISVNYVSIYLTTYVESMVLFKEGKGIGEQTTQLKLF